MMWKPPIGSALRLIRATKIPRATNTAEAGSRTCTTTASNGACIESLPVRVKPGNATPIELVTTGIHPNGAYTKPLVASRGNHANRPDVVRQIVVGQVGIGHGEVALQAPGLAP